MSELMIIKVGDPVTGKTVTAEDVKELQRLLKKDCIDALLADSRVNAVEYVKNYDAGGGAE